MGNIYTAKCKKCGYDARLMLGGGLNSIKLNIMMNLLPDSDRAAVQALSDSGRIAAAIGEQEAVRCFHCIQGDELRARCILTVTDTDGAKHVFGESCEFCGGALRIYGSDPTEVSRIPCPDCGNLRFGLTPVGHWD